MVQRRAARYVKRDYQRTTSVTSLLDSLHWQSLQDRRRNARLLHFFKALHGYQGLSQLVRLVSQDPPVLMSLHSHSFLAALTFLNFHSFRVLLLIGIPWTRGCVA